MLQKLQERWKVNSLNLLLILLTFALGGSTCARLAGFLLKLMLDERSLLWWVLYVTLITILWPICVLIISIPLGQFRFFKNYLQRIGKRLSGKKKNNSAPINIVIFASGNGTNAVNLINYFKTNPGIAVKAIFCNNANANIVSKAASFSIPVVIIRESNLQENPEWLLEELKKINTAYIILAGFLKKIPSVVVGAYPGKIINIHPALLPKYGGKGMYGMHVHQAVIQNEEKESGITIHLVDEVYDNGEIIFQASCAVTSSETPETLAMKIRTLEHTHFPAVVHDFIEKQNHR
jgi:formyltetrahydrofolate-dependent phosphoribosylglycinamide formyltransferase